MRIFERLAVAGVLVVAACTEGGVPGPEIPDDPPNPASTIAYPRAPGTARGRILVDASRDGGVWWFPQYPSFDPALPHQGLALADYLRSLDYDVDVLPRPQLVTSELLGGYDLVIRANGFGRYAASEIQAYGDYVSGGGRLLLLGDHMRYAPPDSLASSFGITFAGVTRGDNLLDDFAAHPITQDVVPLYYMVGSAIVGLPGEAQALGRLSAASYVDLNDNSAQDANEGSAPVVLAALSFGNGRVVVFGDTNLWQQVPQPLVGNVLVWLEEN